MALDERYFISPPLDQYFVSKTTGLPLAEGTLTFYRDSARNTFKSVYQLSGSPPNYTYTVLPNPITLSAVGTVENASGDNEIIYFYPYDSEGNLDLYYVVGRDSGGVEQFTREAWPNVTSANDPTQDSFPVGNQISNPQFSRIFINDGLTTVYSVSTANQESILAPDWTFVTTGTGTITVSRTAIDGADNIETHPPYVLNITVSAGISSCILRQRFYANSGLWSSTADRPVFLSATMIAKNLLSGTTSVEMFYQESDGLTVADPIELLSQSFTNAEYTILKPDAVVQMPISTNTDSGDDGYVDIYLSILPESSISISSIQVVPTLNDLSVDLLPYDLNSSNREQALLGDYYIPNLEAKQIPSLLTAWDFPLNPAQWGETGTLLSTPAAASYIWDQTIAIDTAATVTYARNADTSGIQFTTVTGAQNAVAMVQFLNAEQAKKILANKLSVNVNAFRTSAGGAVTMRVYLYRGTNAAAFPSLASNQFIATLATSGVLTAPFTGWAEIPRGGLDTALATVNSYTTLDQLNSNNYDYEFSQWQITDATQIDDTERFAIAVTFSYATASTVFTVNSISVVPGNIPSRPGLQSQDEVVRECQYYYEKSYDIGSNPGTNTHKGERHATQLLVENPAGTANVTSRAFALVYNTRKRITAPTITFYSPSSTINRLEANLRQGAVTQVLDVANTQWSVLASGDTATTYIAANTTNVLITNAGYAASNDGYVLYHYVVDARIGL